MDQATIVEQPHLPSMGSTATTLNEATGEWWSVVGVQTIKLDKLNEFNIKLSENIIILPPKGYFEMLSLLDSSRLVITDSGGLQKEAYFKNKYCVTVRNETEWVELIDEGVNKITGDNTEKIVDCVNYFKSQAEITQKPIYGNGDTSNSIIKELIDFFKKSKQ